MTSRSFTPGCHLGRFRICEELGRGSWAVVHAAEDATKGESIALKWMLNEIDVAALKHEFRILRTLSHPHLVKLHEMHHDHEGVYFTMERVRGEDLLTRCNRERDPATRVEVVRSLFGQLAEALQYLHAAAVLHRDIKPTNVLVDGSDRVVLIDFGLAQHVSTSYGRDFSGTAAYAAPERFRGRAASPSSDWFAFGVMLFQAVTGELPFGRDQRDTERAWMMSLRVRDVGARLGPTAHALTPLVTGLLEPSPERRAGADQVLDVLGRPRRRGAVRRIVGREEHIEWLVSRLGAEDCSLVALTGESGVGKTTLLRAATDALRDRLVILGSRCHPRENVRFNALDGAAVELLAAVRRAGRGHNVRPAVQDEDLELLESVFERAGPPRPGTTTAMVASAFTRTLAAVASKSRTLLWIDDVQWADRDSVPILEQLLVEPGLRITCFVIARGSPEDIPAPLRPPPGDVYHVGPLDVAASQELLQELVPGLAEPRVLALSRLGNGIPVVLRQAALWAIEHPDATLPASFAELMLRLTEQQSQAHRELLELLAVHQHGLDSDVLLARNDTTLSPAFDLLDAGLVEFERSASRYRLRLRHDQIGDTILGGLEVAQRRRHHSHLAEAFERARPEDADALFHHLVGADLIDRARVVAMRSARSFREGLAFHRAAERYRWLVAQCDVHEDLVLLRRELADVLSRGGEASEAGETYLTMISTRPPDERQLRRAAAEQFLRAGDTDRGHDLLKECMREMGLALPAHPITRIGSLLYYRLQIRGLTRRKPRFGEPDPATSARIEVAWSAGLGLNLIDVVASALAQAQFTAAALRDGNRDQVARAIAVEYSFAMNAGGPLSQRRGARLRAAMQALLDEHPRSYTRAMIELCWAAGDYFRGHLAGTDVRLISARRGFEAGLGPQSWELANCGMYEIWSRLERGELESVAAAAPALLRLGTARGDRLYRQCFVRGFCGTAWLIEDRVEELATLLDELPPPVGSFQMQHFFELIARQRLDLYRGDYMAAWRRIHATMPALRSSGFLQMRWFRLTVGILSCQAALGVADRPEARALAIKWIDRIAAIDHPAASPWSIALRAGLNTSAARRPETMAALETAETGLRGAGFHLAALAVRHHRGLLGAPVDAAWPDIVRRPGRLAAAVGLPPPASRQR